MFAMVGQSDSGVHDDVRALHEAKSDFHGTPNRRFTSRGIDSVGHERACRQARSLRGRWSSEFERKDCAHGRLAKSVRPISEQVQLAMSGFDGDDASTLSNSTEPDALHPANQHVAPDMVVSEEAQLRPYLLQRFGKSFRFAGVRTLVGASDVLAKYDALRRVMEEDDVERRFCAKAFELIMCVVTTRASTKRLTRPCVV